MADYSDLNVPLIEVLDDHFVGCDFGMGGNCEFCILISNLEQKMMGIRELLYENGGQAMLNIFDVLCETWYQHFTSSFPAGQQTHQEADGAKRLVEEFFESLQQNYPQIVLEPTDDEIEVAAEMEIISGG